MPRDRLSTTAPTPLLVRLLPLALCIALLCVRPTAGQDGSQPDTSSTSLREALRENSYPIRLEEGDLRGRGGQWLRERAKEATLITLGESHGTREIPALIHALLDTLQGAGELDHLALEVSPWTARTMTERLQTSTESYNALIEAHPAAVPFYSLRPERDLIRSVVQNSTHPHPLWGLDQIFAFSTTIALDRLKTLAPSPAARSAVEYVRAVGQADSTEAPALQNLPPSLPTPIMAYSPITFDTLRSHFEERAEAQLLIDEITKSIEIYRLNRTDNYRSNQIRARYMRRNLQRNYSRALKNQEEAPQVAIKVGGRHAYRGRTPNNALDVGNAAVSLAQQTGGSAFNVAVVCGPGSSAQNFPTGTMKCWSETRAPFKSAMTDGPTLFDLTALHPLLHRKALDPTPKLERLLWAFDAVVLVPNAQPAELIASPLSP